MQITLTFNSIAELEDWQKRVRVISKSALKDALAASPLNADIDALQLPSRIVNALKFVGIKQVSELIDMTSEQLFSIDNIGRNSIREIQSALRDVGLALRSGDELPGRTKVDYPERMRPPEKLLPERLRSITSADMSRVMPAEPYDPAKATHHVLAWDNDSLSYVTKERPGPHPDLPQQIAPDVGSVENGERKAEPADPQ